MTLDYYYYNVQIPFFDGDDDVSGGSTDTGTKDTGTKDTGTKDTGTKDTGTKDTGGNPNDPKTKDSYSKEEVEKMKQEYQQQLKNYADDLETFQKKVKMTDSERKDLQDKVEKLRNQALSEKEQRERAINKIESEKQKQIESLSKERDEWKDRYTTSLKTRSLMDAAVKNKAIDPQQIVDIFYHKTELVEELDKEENPTGNLIPKTTIQDKTKEGETISLQLPVEDAIKRLSEIESYWNLFQGEGTGGTGRNTQRKATTHHGSLAHAAKTSPEEYRKLRRGK